MLHRFAGRCPLGGVFALGRPSGDYWMEPPRSAASRVAAPRGGLVALGRPGGDWRSAASDSSVKLSPLIDELITKGSRHVRTAF
jgi:hypothetical protein